MPDNSVITVGGAKPFYSGTLAAPKQIITGSCTVVALTLLNPTAAGLYVQIFDALAANVTAGTTVPLYEEFVAAAAAAVPGRTIVTLPTSGGIFMVALTAVATNLEGGSVGGAGVAVGWYH